MHLGDAAGFAEQAQEVREETLMRTERDRACGNASAQVTGLFRRSRVIGRRFQIVHVMYGRETIEVSTFRALQTDALTDEHGRVLRDNVWGTQAEDATRRDQAERAMT